MGVRDGRTDAPINQKRNEVTPLLHDDLFNDGNPGEGNGTVWGSVFNLCNSAIGAGILALPFAIQQTGILFGSCLVLAMGLVCAFNLKVIIHTNKLYMKATSYEKLVAHLFGRGMSWLVLASVILTTFGACTGFLIIIADLISPIIELIITEEGLEWTHHRAVVTIFLSIVAILPLASLKDFHALRFSSLLAISSVTFTVFIILFRSFEHLHDFGDRGVLLYKIDLGIFDALPLMCFAFGCHMQIVPIFGELRDNQIMNRVNWLVGCTSAVCIFLYSITAGFGYLTFLDKTNSNILTNYPFDDLLVNFGRALLTLTIICHYPSANHPCRVAVDYAIFGDRPPSTPRRLIEVLCIWGISLIAALFIPDIRVVFGFIGATANALIVLIFPAIFLLRLHRHPKWTGLTGFFAIVIGFIVLLLGVGLAVTGTGMIIRECVSEKGCTSGGGH